MKKKKEKVCPQYGSNKIEFIPKYKTDINMDTIYCPECDEDFL